MTTTTTFNQVIREQVFTITVPVTKVEKLINRVDFLLEQGKPRCDMKAIQLVKQYVGAPEVKEAPKVAAPKGTDAMVERADKARSLGRYNVIKMLQADFGISYQKARNIAIKAGVE